jgi:hypothetical protein
LKVADLRLTLAFQENRTNKTNLSQFPEILKATKKGARPANLPKVTAMPRLLEPFHNRASRLADMAQPVILAMGTAGLTGGAMAALALVTDRAIHSRASAR